MNQTERNIAYREFLRAWGEASQLIMAVEEAAELQKEITKYLRGEDNLQFILEEVADVEVMLEQLKLMFKFPQKVVDEQKEMKINIALEKAKKYTFDVYKKESEGEGE